MTSRVRRIEHIIDPQPVMEGAGVRLKRSIGTPTLDYLDPFLLLTTLPLAIEKTMKPASRSIPTEALKRSPMYCRGRFSTGIPWVMPAASGRGRSSG